MMRDEKAKKIGDRIVPKNFSHNSIPSYLPERPNNASSGVLHDAMDTVPQFTRHRLTAVCYVLFQALRPPFTRKTIGFTVFTPDLSDCGE